MSEQDPPKIEFPCEYPIKVLGRSEPEFEELVFEVFERHAPGFDRLNVSRNSSSKGTFNSVTITINATGKDQLEALHQELISSELVKMVI